GGEGRGGAVEVVPGGPEVGLRVEHVHRRQRVADAVGAAAGVRAAEHPDAAVGRHGGGRLVPGTGHVRERAPGVGHRVVDVGFVGGVVRAGGVVEAAQAV